MKIKYAFIYFLTVLQCLSCNIQEAERAANLVTYKMVLYSDSTYGHPMDSLVYTNHEDTTYFHEKFQPDGYFRIYRASSPSFNEGKLKNGREIGHWRFYGFEEDENNRLSTIVESNYNDRSELHGEELIYYCIDGKLVLRTVFNYINGNEQGIEKEFYKSGALAFCCEKDGNGKYINNYLVLYENGDTVYHENFGDSGTGWLKKYNIFNSDEVLFEVELVNKKREGWLHSYVTDPEINRRVLYGKSFYKNDTILHRVVYPLRGSQYKYSYIDSIVGIYEYDDTIDYIEPKQVIYYYKGKISRIEKHNSPYF